MKSFTTLRTTFCCLLISSLCFEASAGNREADSTTSNAAFGSSFGSYLPNTGAMWPFPKGAVWINLNTSLGVWGYPSLGTRSAFLPFTVAAEYSIDPHWAFGPYFGYHSVSYSDSYLGESYSGKLRNILFGARLTFHGADVIKKYFGADINIKKWDIYGTLSAGMNSRNWNVENRFEQLHDYESNIYPSLGFVIGAKYFAYSTFAVHGEFGKGPFGFVNFGVSYWLK